MVSVARKNLLSDIPRFLVAQAGILFAVSLITLQTGIFTGFTRSTVQPIKNATADIWVASQELVQLELTLPMPAEYTARARDLEGVARAESLIFDGAPSIPPEGGASLTRIRVTGFDPEGELFDPQNLVAGEIGALSSPYRAIVDRTDGNLLQVDETGDFIQIGSLAAQVSGLTEGNSSLVSDPFVLTSLANARAFQQSEQLTEIACEAAAELECTASYPRLQLNAATLRAQAQPQALAPADPIIPI